MERARVRFANRWRASLAPSFLLGLLVPGALWAQEATTCFRLSAGPWYAVPGMRGGTRDEAPPDQRADSLAFFLPEAIALTEEIPARGIARAMGERGWKVFKMMGGDAGHDTTLWSSRGDSLFLALFTSVPDPGLQVGLQAYDGGWSGTALTLDGLDALRLYERAVSLEPLTCPTKQGLGGLR